MDVENQVQVQCIPVEEPVKPIAPPSEEQPVIYLAPPSEAQLPANPAKAVTAPSVVQQPANPVKIITPPPVAQQPASPAKITTLPPVAQQPANPAKITTLPPLREKNFLNYTERKIFYRAMDRLAVKGNLTNSLMKTFTEYDENGTGTVSENEFIRTLRINQMHSDISTTELEVFFKSFRPSRNENCHKINYREFVDELEEKYKHRSACPFWCSN